MQQDGHFWHEVERKTVFMQVLANYGDENNERQAFLYWRMRVLTTIHVYGRADPCEHRLQHDELAVQLIKYLIE